MSQGRTIGSVGSSAPLTPCYHLELPCCLRYYIQRCCRIVPPLQKAAMGILHAGLNEIWNTDNLSDKLTKALKVKEKRDVRSELGYKRKGRILAGPVAKRVLNEHSNA